MDLDSLIQLDKQVLLTVNGSDSLFIDGLALALTNAATWIPLYVALFFVVLRNNESVRQILVVILGAALCVVLAGTVDDTFVKPMVGRWRPTHDPDIGFFVDSVDGYLGGKYGFFSAHAANTMSIAVFFSLLIRHKIFSFMLVCWSLVNCWTRMYLGVHYLGDILFGILWGVIVGISVYCLFHQLNKRISTGMNFISSQYTATGYNLADINVALNVLCLTYIYVMIDACFMLP